MYRYVTAKAGEPFLCPFCSWSMRYENGRVYGACKHLDQSLTNATMDRIVWCFKSLNEEEGR